MGKSWILVYFETKDNTVLYYVANLLRCSTVEQFCYMINPSQFLIKTLNQPKLLNNLFKVHQLGGCLDQALCKVESG